jgi:DNA-directed RNA polymerase subunit H (RpoH/RPB5)
MTSLKPPEIKINAMKMAMVMIRDRKKLRSDGWSKDSEVPDLDDGELGELDLTSPTIERDRYLIVHVDPASKTLVSFDAREDRTDRADRTNHTDQENSDAPEGLTGFIALVPSTPSVLEMKSIRSMFSKVNNRVPVEFHTWDSMLRLIPYHLMQPIRWTLVSREHFEQTHIGIRAERVQQMLTSDPIAKYFALKSGELVRVDRASTTGIETTSYRYLVDGA